MQKVESNQRDLIDHFPTFRHSDIPTFRHSDIFEITIFVETAKFFYTQKDLLTRWMALCLIKSFFFNHCFNFFLIGNHS